MTNEELRNIQKMDFYVLKEIKRVCEKNNIPYFLIGGTLIGAIRHKGFIPWDDDIDIAMLRPDFERFLEVCKTDLGQEFFLQTPLNESNCADYGLARIRLNETKIIIESRKSAKLHEGFYVEVFPYDKLPDNKISQFFYGNWFPVLKRVYAIRKGYKPHPRTLYARVAVNFFNALLKPVSTEKLKKKLDSYHLKYAQKNTKKLFLLSGAWGYKRESHPVERFAQFTTAEFEGETFTIPADYDGFLKEQYGNYMELPPPEKRVNHHKIIEMDYGKYEYLLK